MHGIDVVAATQARERPRQRCLRRPVLRQWRRPAGIAAG